MRHVRPLNPIWCNRWRRCPWARSPVVLAIDPQLDGRAAVLGPLVGAAVDYTDKRFALLKASQYTLIAGTAASVVVGVGTWAAVVVLALAVPLVAMADPALLSLNKASEIAILQHVLALHSLLAPVLVVLILPVLIPRLHLARPPGALLQLLRVRANSLLLNLLPLFPALPALRCGLAASVGLFVDLL